jgi:hypothetical protein
VRNHGVGPVHRPHQINLNEALVHLRRDLLERPPQAGPGVVDPHVHPAERSDGCVDHLAHPPRVGDVARDGQCPSAECLALPGRVIQAVPTTGDQHHIVAPARERTRRAQPDPARATGDDDGPRRTLALHRWPPYRFRRPTMSLDRGRVRGLPSSVSSQPRPTGRTRADAEARRDGGRELLPAAGGCTHAGRAIAARATTRKTGVLLAGPGAGRPAVPEWRLATVGTADSASVPAAIYRHHRLGDANRCRGLAVPR